MFANILEGQECQWPGSRAGSLQFCPDQLSSAEDPWQMPSSLSPACSGVTGLHGLVCVTQGLSLLTVQLHPLPSLMWHQPLGKTLALAPRGSWEPILGGLHFLKLDSYIFP